MGELLRSHGIAQNERCPEEDAAVVQAIVPLDVLWCVFLPIGVHANYDVHEVMMA